MAERHMWMEYVDLGAKVAVPIVVVAATLWVNAALESRRVSDANASQRRQDYQNCLENQFKLAAALCGDAQCTPSRKRTEMVNGLGALTAKACGAHVVEPIAKATVNVAAQGGDVGQTARVAQALGLAETPKSVETSAPPIIAHENPPTKNLRPRVYIQISEESQRVAANSLAARLSTSKLNDRTLIGMPAELRPGVRTNELRCTKAVDCGEVGALAAYVGALIGQQVKPVDLSARYEHSSTVRPGHYELWLAPGPLTLAGGASP